MSGKPNGTSDSQQRTIDNDIALLTSLLSSTNAEGADEHDLDGPEIQELLRRLEAADGVAQGVESRLDEIIGSLDGLLGSLESGEASAETGVEQAAQEVGLRDEAGTQK